MQTGVKTQVIKIYSMEMRKHYQVWRADDSHMRIIAMIPLTKQKKFRSKATDKIERFSHKLRAEHYPARAHRKDVATDIRSTYNVGGSWRNVPQLIASNARIYLRQKYKRGLSKSLNLLRNS